MIEATESCIDGVRFIDNIRFCEPYLYENGVKVERVSERLLIEGRHIDLMLKALGLRRVGWDYCYRSAVYAHYPIGYVQYKAVRFLLQGYWRTIKFLYSNARMFKQIPEAECFSWRYFTPYTWFKKQRLVRNQL